MVAGKTIYRASHFTNIDVDQIHGGIAALAELQEKTAQDDLALGTPIIPLTRDGKI